jgi:uncharacterized protein (TIGR04255 family)
MESFNPLHAAHAIEQVVFYIQFGRPISDNRLAELKTICDQFSEELPGLSDTTGLSVVFGNVIGNQQASHISGFTRRSVNRDGTLEHELRVEKSSIQFVTTRYTRWQQTWDQANKYFNALLPLFQQDAIPAAIGLNYVDKFVWAGNPENCRAEHLIRTDSKYVSKHIFETTEFWHSHAGVFIRSNPQTRRLLNLNIDYLDEPRPNGLKRVVQIATTLTDQFNQPSYEELSKVENIQDFFNSHMQDMHSYGKIILIDVMTEDMSKRIALTG